MKMKIGQQVAVCQDGKWGRAKLGVVIATKNGYSIKVRFSTWRFPEGKEAELVETEHWFGVRQRPTKFGGRRKEFRGWCDIPDSWCPWYSVVPLKLIRAAGVNI